MSEEPRPAKSPLEALLDLQDADIHIDQLRHRRGHLPEHEQLARIEAELGARAKAIGALESSQADLRGRTAELEVEIGTARTRRTQIDDRLTSSSAGSFRDQEAMATEMRSLSERIADLEDVELEVLEELEPLETELDGLVAERSSAEDARAALTSEIAQAQAAIDVELVEAATERAVLAGAVPDALIEEYERIRPRLDGIGAARLIHGACSGCHLQVPATEVDQMRHAAEGTIFHCDQCGRILVST
jgi:uncharacterized protein